MNALRLAAILSILIALPGCTAFQTAGEFQRGRTALLGGMPAAATTYFRQAAALDPNLRYSVFQEGIWTYLGRAHYEAKNYAEARNALERALTVDSSDSFARLYLGLTLARQGNHEAGQKEVLLGLQGLYDGLEYVVYYTSVGPFWDPTGQIRGEIQALQRDVKASEPHFEKLFDRLESLGKRVEQEIDLARRDESFDRNRRSGDM
jgi:tetratricopeptide (TPR) repeat protein